MRAFTIVELLVAVLIFSLILGGIFGIVHVADKSWDSTLGMLGLVQEIRQGMDGMTREARQSSFSQAAVSMGGARLDFFTPGSNSVISYYVQNNQLIREYPAGTTKVLANHINQINFISSASMLQIQVTANKTTIGNRALSISSVQQVKWRN